MTWDVIRYMLIHAACAAAFIFVLNYYFLKTGLQSSVFWGIGFAVMAAGLAYQQSRRSGS